MASKKKLRSKEFYKVDVHSQRYINQSETVYITARSCGEAGDRAIGVVRASGSYGDEPDPKLYVHSVAFQGYVY